MITFAILWFLVGVLVGLVVGRVIRAGSGEQVAGKIAP